jgi:hypothetical protein
MYARGFTRDLPDKRLLVLAEKELRVLDTRLKLRVRIMGSTAVQVPARQASSTRSSTCQQTARLHIAHSPYFAQSNLVRKEWVVDDKHNL